MSSRSVVAEQRVPNLSLDSQITDTPTTYATTLFENYCAHAKAEVRRELGQFFTPPSVARFMANLAIGIRRHSLQILEPGAGTGVLISALCENLPGTVRKVHLDVYEICPPLAELCNKALDFTSRWMRETRGIECAFNLQERDFVLENASHLTPSLFGAVANHYDIAIANPPYFKLHKEDRRARAASHIVHGQPNIYAIFMAIIAALLRDNGVMVTITPRSFTTGDYFRRFRQVLFSNVVPEAVHLFSSRRDAFRTDDVLQENVIMKCRRTSLSEDATVVVSTSEGISDIDRRTERKVPLRDVVNLNSRELAIHIPVSSLDDEILATVRSWPANLQSLGLQVSTGPVVAFRAREFLRSGPANGECVVPLLWLQHVRPMDVSWPLKVFGKQEYILSSRESAYLLLPNDTYVVLRRFSAKEEARRLVAAPLFKNHFPGNLIGLENHLNYIRRPKGRMSHDEAVGLAALLNSSVVDRFFRISNGNTQVSAVELRQLPLPRLEQIEGIGQTVGQGVSLDQAVAQALNVPAKLLWGLERSANGET